ncbi:MAG TPA: hypothetical protein VHT51_19960 [Micropepsaceae bacterium]|jgi:hypothetical protein|nr:hypothetical protein [Micropepsaceae bacterium]
MLRSRLKLSSHGAAIFALALTVAPASAASENAMMGRWFTEGFEKGAHIQVIFDIKPSGTYDKDIRVIDNCDIAATGKETGSWMIDGQNLITVSETFDGMPATGSNTNNRFTITRVDDEHVNLFDTETKLDWGLMLVSASYVFPAARGCGI